MASFALKSGRSVLGGALSKDDVEMVVTNKDDQDTLIQAHLKRSPIRQYPTPHVETYRSRADNSRYSWLGSGSSGCYLMDKTRRVEGEERGSHIRAYKWAFTLSIYDIVSPRSLSRTIDAYLTSSFPVLDTPTADN